LCYDAIRPFREDRTRMFLPTTKQELDSLGWERPDVILITGDTYIDSPHIGVAAIGKYLLKHGFKTALIAQPSTNDGKDITRLGEPAIFWGVTGGCIDSMVANFTPMLKRRHEDDYTPGGVNRRPPRAAIAYAYLIRRHFKNTKPIVLGGLEASLRRVAHYDYWDDAVRRSILFDAKADFLAYGMAEKTVVELARALKAGADGRSIRGLCHIAAAPPDGYLPLPSFEEVLSNKPAFRRMALLLHRNMDPASPGLVQRHGKRYLVQNPPPPPLRTEDLDEIYDLDYERDAHPYYKTGVIRALDTIRQSVTTHRGCFGQCHFCAIAAHQGRRVVFRSVPSILREVERIRDLPGFNGIITDVGGPTANMYGTACVKGWACRDTRCLMPRICPNLQFGHKAQMELLRRVMGVPGIKKVFVSSGIRHDLVVADKEQGRRYVEQLLKHHVSGQIKLAPEHAERDVLALMNKPTTDSLVKFKWMYDRACAELGKRYFMTYYIMAAHPGCTARHMRRLQQFLVAELRNVPEQVQIFTPTPSTLSTAMYYCETDTAGKPLFCEKRLDQKQLQKDIVSRGPAISHGRRRGHRGFGRGMRSHRGMS
jgi:uncharacterized radical SAM protein YgiQ